MLCAPIVKVFNKVLLTPLVLSMWGIRELVFLNYSELTEVL